MRNAPGRRPRQRKPLAEIVRQAIRNALDDTDLTLGTKRTFDRRLQKRVAEMEQNLKQSLEQGLHRVEVKLAESLQGELDKLEYRVNQDFDRSLSKFTKHFHLVRCCTMRYIRGRRSRK